ncbi:MAG: 30S ribosome-binding factor RbfA [Myxococcota bacterium]|nr:30S ribosome-binding factor RbfA [Myxococcota bacterium]
MSRRTERVGEEIRSELARLLREEVSDPRVGLVTLTRVDLAPDMRNARVYWSRVQERGGGNEPEDDQRAEAGLASAAGFLRRRLAQLLPTKRVPELRFRHDPSLALGSDTLALLREIAADAEPAEDADGEVASDE